MQNPWDVRPKADNGDPAPQGIFLSVGAALTSWEQLESELAQLFDTMLASANHAAFRVYRSIVTSKARTEMLEAALPVANAGLGGAINPVLADLINDVKEFGARRNEIAHGQVYNLGPEGYFLGPSNLNARKWRDDGMAKYQYVAADVAYYSDQFQALRDRCVELTNDLRALRPDPTEDVRDRRRRSRSREDERK